MSKKADANFEEQREAQKSLLRKQIAGERKPTGRGNFLVFPMEAGVGKTTAMKEGLAQLCKYPSAEKALVVTFFTLEADDIASAINEMAGEGTAISIHSKVEDKMSVIEKIPDTPVLIITHETYRRLCSITSDKAWQKRNFYRSGRNTLIIDEEVDLLDVQKLTIEELYAYFRIIVSRKGEPSKNIHSVIIKLFECGNMTFLNDIFSDKQLNLLREYLNIDVDIKLEGTEKIKINGKVIEVDSKKFSRISQMLIRILRNQYSVLTKHELYTYDSLAVKWNMDNNIILDASANINEIYNNSIYTVEPTEKIQDHSYWNVCVWDENSSKYHKQNTKDFYDRVSGYIADHLEKNEKALILCLKGDGTEEDELKTRLLAQNTQGHYDFASIHSVKGLNDWRDYRKCFVIQTPNEPFVDYVFRYLMVHPEKKLTSADLYLGTKNHCYGFEKNDELESFRKSYVSAVIYQGIKRIARDEKDTSHVEVTIINNDEDIINMVTQQLKNVEVSVVDQKWLPPKPIRKESKYTKAFIKELRRYIQSGDSDPLPKTVVKEIVGCSDTQFKRIMKQDKIMKLIKDNKIQVKNKEFKRIT
jgi:hypothetical protein